MILEEGDTPIANQNTTVATNATGVLDDVTGMNDEATGVNSEATGVDANETAAETIAESDDETPQRSSFGRELRSTQDDDFVYQHLQNSTDTEIQQRQPGIAKEIMEGNIFTQYSLRAGLKRWPERGRQATVKELKQMLSRVVFREINYHELTNEDKRNALPILIFLSEKWGGSIKTRACADGRKEKIWTQKIDSSSPTLSIEALYHSLAIDAQESCDVATYDLPGCFL